MNRSFRPIAYFDFDGTLTTGDTLMPFLKYLLGRRTYFIKLLVLSPVLLGYFMGVVRNDVAKRLVLKYYLAGRDIGKLFEVGLSFSEDVIPGMLREEGMERFYWHKEQGHECVLVSASLDVYLKPWARAVGFDSIITSSLHVDDELVTGKLNGGNCFGAEKSRRILDNPRGFNERATYAYGDTEGDRYMLRIVQHGFMLKHGKFVEINE